MHYQLLHGDNREQLKHLADNSIDSIVCDPPYELGFMGKRWDSTGIAYDITVWSECLRVLKPGGHLIAFGGTRTYHRMTVAIEDAGFEIRDCIMWLYGSGFPKSHDVSKALDKQVGAEREVITEKRSDMFGEYEVDVSYQVPDASKVNPHFISADTKRNQTNDYNKSYSPTAPATDLAKQWHGWGTALKPAVEPAVLARKPLIGTVADNVTTWGVGGINVDGCRVGDFMATQPSGLHRGNIADYSPKNEDNFKPQLNATSGRWPANVILDEYAGEALDEQSGERISRKFVYKNTDRQNQVIYGGWAQNNDAGYSDSGGASRFFYTAKASKAEREAGLEGMEIKNNMRVNAPRESEEQKHATHRANHHPTVKPIALMRYLVRLVTPKGGTVLDPFMGSGSTGCAAMCEGVNFVGIELSEEYLEIARRRIEYWQSQNPMGL